MHPLDFPGSLDFPDDQLEIDCVACLAAVGLETTTELHQSTVTGAIDVS